MIRKRCAIYSRKSTEDGLEQEFNSLDAQGEACSAYILSQAGEGWEEIDTLYSDGGVSGGHMERPGLKALLQDVEDGKVDIIVVYKVDRLTRSLADFAKLVEIFDQHGVSFVSVTQAFNTTNSMGRLTLNVLLSFAQFEREVTAERIRDKIAASKKKGKWMGGLVPLGYDALDKKLVINTDEAEAVGYIFKTYQQLGTVTALTSNLSKRGYVTKRRVSKKGNQSGSMPYSRGHLYQLLSNPVYIGKTRHKEKIFEGEHEPIIDLHLWEAVQAQLKSNAPIRKRDGNQSSGQLLTGLLYDAQGDRLGPSSHKKNGKRYSYYISRRLLKGELDDGTGWRLPAKTIETHVLTCLSKLLTDQAALLRTVEMQVPQYSPTTAKDIKLVSEKVKGIHTNLQDANPIERRAAILNLVSRITLSDSRLSIGLFMKVLVSDANDELITFDYPLIIKRRGIETCLIIGGRSCGEPDPKLLTMIAKARDWYARLKTEPGLTISALAKSENMHRSDIGKLLPLAFLSPVIIRRFMIGEHPAELTVDKLKSLATKLPSHWDEQAAYLGIAA